MAEKSKREDRDAMEPGDGCIRKNEAAEPA